MRVLRTIAIAAVLGTGAPVAAADFITIPVDSNSIEMPLVDDAPFDWSGFYTGVFGAAQLGEAAGTQLGLGVAAGANAQFDFFLVGAEVAMQGLTGDTVDTAYGQVVGRAGLVLTDDVLLYAAAGYGIDLGGPSEDDALLGGGMELALTENLSLRAQYLHGFSLSEGENNDQITFGANFHF